MLHTDAKLLTTIIGNLGTDKVSSVMSGWMAELAEFDFDVKHIAGVDNLLADLASRVQLVQIDDNATPSNGQMDQILMESHQGHWGAVGMHRWILINYPHVKFTKLYSKCLQFASKCIHCLQVNRNRVVFAPLKEPVLYLPMQDVHCDLMVMPRSDAGYTYVLVMIDRLTKFVWLTPLLTKEMNEVVQAMLSVFLMFGFPQSIKTDQGSEFVNEMAELLCKIAHVREGRFEVRKPKDGIN